MEFDMDSCYPTDETFFPLPSWGFTIPPARLDPKIETVYLQGTNTLSSASIQGTSKQGS